MGAAVRLTKRFVKCAETARNVEAQFFKSHLIKKIIRIDFTKVLIVVFPLSIFL